MSKQLNLHEFEMGRTLGRGTFASVKLAKFKGDGKFYAIKSMKKHRIIALRQVEHINNERKLLAGIDYPFIVNLLGHAKDDFYVHIVMELVPGGDLFTHLCRARKFSNDTSKFFAALIGAAFAHLHSRNIIFRDLKPENVVLMSNGYAKLTDFGYARHLDPGTSAYTLCGTPEYIAPEILLNKGHGKAVDWWGLGILIFEMTVGQPPFVDCDALGIYEKSLMGRVYYPTFLDYHCKSLVRHLLHKDPAHRHGNKRDGHNDVLKHRWLGTMDYVRLERFEVPAPYKPPMTDNHDTYNFEDVPASTEKPVLVEGAKDPFLNW